jgi:hypothetical protein
MNTTECVFGFQYKVMLTFGLTVISKVYGIHFWIVPLEIKNKKARLDPEAQAGLLKYLEKLIYFQNRLNRRGPPLTGVASMAHIPRPWVAITTMLSLGWMIRSWT